MTFLKKRSFVFVFCFLLLLLVFSFAFLPLKSRVQAESAVSADSDPTVTRFPSPSDLSVTASQLSFNKFLIPTSGIRSSSSSPSMANGYLNFFNFDFQIRYQEGSTQYWTAAGPHSKFSPSLFSSSLSTSSATFYTTYGPFFSSTAADVYSTSTAEFTSSELGYRTYTSDSSFAWNTADSFTPFSYGAGDTASNLPFNTFVAFRAGFSTTSNPAYRYFAIFGIFIPVRFTLTNLAYLEFSEVPSGSVAPNGVPLTVGLNANTRLSVCTFYDSDSVPRLYLYFPYVNGPSSNRDAFSLNGVVRYSSFSVDGSASWSEAYNLGYSAGESAGTSSGYNSGFSSGESSGYNNGYSVGFSAGVDSANTYSFMGLLSAVFNAPISAVTGLLDFDVLGFHMSTFFFSLLTLAIVVKIVMVIA